MATDVTQTAPAAKRPRERHGFNGLPLPVRILAVTLLLALAYALPLLRPPILTTNETDFGGVMFRVIAFALENAAHQGTYFNGLANTVEANCRAPDDLTRPLGDPLEGSVKTALDYLAGRSCTPISSAGQTTLALSNRRELLTPERPNTAQRETPGLF